MADVFSVQKRGKVREALEVRRRDLSLNLHKPGPNTVGLPIEASLPGRRVAEDRVEAELALDLAWVTAAPTQSKETVLRLFRAEHRPSVILNTTQESLLARLKKERR